MTTTPIASMVPPDMDDKLDEAMWQLPGHTREGLARYLRFGVPPGHFLFALLSNDLAKACARADGENKNALARYVYFLYNHAPSAAWGSPEKVKAWIERGRLNAGGQP